NCGRSGGGWSRPWAEYLDAPLTAVAHPAGDQKLQGLPIKCDLISSGLNGIISIMAAQKEWALNFTTSIAVCQNLPYGQWVTLQGSLAAKMFTNLFQYCADRDAKDTLEGV
uniref:Uncharacterized protein n=1 Tax=Romanomermis culicivorax TaxID=13658 RepID=A0A915KCX8_ROMCU